MALLHQAKEMLHSMESEVREGEGESVMVMRCRLGIWPCSATTWDWTSSRGACIKPA